MQYHALGSGRYVLRLDPGDDVLASIRQVASENEVAAGFVTGLGSTSQATLGFLDPETGEYAKRRFDEPMEVCNLTGTLSVSAEDGRIFVHLHAVLAPRELIAYGGHVHEARTGAVMEVLLWSFPDKLERFDLEDKAFPWLVLPGEPRPDEGGSVGS